MIARKVLTLLLAAVAPKVLLTQGIERHSRSGEPSDASAAFFLQAPIPDAPTFKERPVLSKAVAVEALGIRIPPPPASVEMASMGYRDIHHEAVRALAFLKQELDQLEKDQSAALALLKGNPTLAQLGTDSDLFRVLLALSRDTEAFQARKAFLEAGRQAQAFKEEADKGSQQLVNTMHAAARNESEELTKAFGTPVPMISRWFLETRGTLEATSANRELSAYVRAWGDYSEAINRFVDRVADALKVPEKELPPSTLLLVRLLKIQVFRIYSIQIREQVQMWAEAARVGVKPIPRPFGWDVDRH
jgi:hypothetical protein